MLPHAAHPRQVVLELGELDLELALGADARAGRRCRGSAACGRRRAPRARSRATAAATGSSSSSTTSTSAPAPRSPASARRACPCRRTCARRGAAGAGRGGRPARRRRCARAPRARPAPRRDRLLGRARRGRTRARARGPAPDRAVALPCARHYDVVPCRLPDLAARTLELVDVPSESRHEAAAMELVRRLLVGDAPLRRRRGRCSAGDPAAPVVLAGHLDTVPAQGNLPGRIEGGAVHGLGASDMKGGVAVDGRARPRRRIPARYLFFTREEVPVAREPAAGAVRDGACSQTRSSRSCSSRPTASSTRAASATCRRGCDFHGESAHSARPWTGVNAIHELVRGLAGLVGARAARRRAGRARLPRGRERGARSRAGSPRTSFPRGRASS